MKKKTGIKIKTRGLFNRTIFVCNPSCKSRQYIIIGDCNALPNDWTLGSENDRRYAAVSNCNTGCFSNCDSGKRIGPCDIVLDGILQTHNISASTIARPPRPVKSDIIVTGDITV